MSEIKIKEQGKNKEKQQIFNYLALLPLFIFILDVILSRVWYGNSLSQPMTDMSGIRVLVLYMPLSIICAWKIQGKKICIFYEIIYGVFIIMGIIFAFILSGKTTEQLLLGSLTWTSLLLGSTSMVMRLIRRSYTYFRKKKTG